MIKRKACVVGAGPNGLAAAIVLAQAGLHVDVFEAQTTPGGAVRTLELTLPGFQHDFGSAVYPLGASSPFFSWLPLRQHGLEWVHSPAPLAHPLDDGTAVILDRKLDRAVQAFGEDGPIWNKLTKPFVENWAAIVPELLAPISFLPAHPLLMARFAAVGFRSAGSVAQRFRSERTRALWAGLAAHSFLSLDEPLSAAFALMMAVPAHAIGWPIPRGGAQSLTKALCSFLGTFSSTLKTSTPVEDLADLEDYDLVLCDVTPRQLLQIGKKKLTMQYQQQLEKFQYGSAVFKVDYALSSPIPWKATECLQAATVHIGGSLEEIAESEKAVRQGRHTDRPFVLLAQPTLFDSSRAPTGKHTAWAYCHVPHNSKVDMLGKMEEQIERFAPGFRECILARNVYSPSNLESMDANLVGGDINGGMMDIRHFLGRPTRRLYATSASDVYICSSSTPPGGGVHGMCGYHAAKLALKNLKSRKN